ncbi:MAG: SDR family oxidoreductase [Acidobacteriota bacterium]|nr:SDR family oxidoreductase [Acidobacteriota bacterium]
MRKNWSLADVPSLTGRRAFLTGANSGIGYFTALELARKGATVVMAVRDAARGEAAMRAIRQQVPEAQLELAVVDLGSLDSVRRVAERELERGLPLHLLINNAGVMAPPRRRLTIDGYELQFGTNVLAHFVLTGHLLPALEQVGDVALNQAQRPRIIYVASIAHKRGRLNFNDLQSVRRYSPMASYQQSKLADLMLALETNRRLEARGSGVLSLAAHPGVAQTNLFKFGSSKGLFRGLEIALSSTIGKVLNSGLEGALPTLYAATAEDVTGGGYYGPTGFQEMRGSLVGDAEIALQARREDDAEQLWEVCERLTGMRYLDHQP